MPPLTHSLHRPDAHDTRPVSPFASPIDRARPATHDPEIERRFKELEKEYKNPPTEKVPVLSSNPVWKLADIIGAEAVAQIEHSGQLSFHTVGDTGFNSFPLVEKTATVEFGKVNKSFATAQEMVIHAMCGDFTESIASGPAFFLHLGDVIYFQNTRTGYQEQFYEPYATYGRKIIAITGNHDVEVRLGEQANVLAAFRENFCAATPGIRPAGKHVHPPREMVAQPGVFWRLDAPFVQIIGLCSNVGESGGALRGGNAGQEQYAWLLHTLAEVATEQKAAGQKRRALIVALHHPPYTTGNHEASKTMNHDLDQAFETAKVWPDAVLAAHDHNYQRFTRTVELAGGKSIEIPYIVAGGGGRYHVQRSHRTGDTPDPVPGLEQNRFEAGNGYVIVTARKTKLTLSYRAVDNLSQNKSERISVDLHTRRVIS